MNTKKKVLKFSRLNNEALEELNTLKQFGYSVDDELREELHELAINL